MTKKTRKNFKKLKTSKNFEKLKTSKQLLQGIAPTAINMQAIATMFRFNEAEMAALIFWQHLAYLVTLPLYICG